MIHIKMNNINYLSQNVKFDVAKYPTKNKAVLQDEQHTKLPKPHQNHLWPNLNKSERQPAKLNRWFTPTASQFSTWGTGGTDQAAGHIEPVQPGHQQTHSSWGSTWRRSSGENKVKFRVCDASTDVLYYILKFFFQMILIFGISLTGVSFKILKSKKCISFSIQHKILQTRIFMTTMIHFKG